MAVMKQQSKKLSELQRQVQQTIAEHRMFQTGDRVLVGVSGGPDSVALLHILMEIAPEYALTLAIGHLNHSLRGGASDRDAEFVEALARQTGLAIFSEKKDVRRFGRHHRLSIEAAGRRVRYAFFTKTCETHGFNKIALGHHLDDNAELILMNLLRGSGPAGLSGIPPVRDHHIVRPLIDITRQQIMAYLTRKKCDYVTDASNTDCRYLRNRIRSELLPMLTTEYNGNLAANLHKMAIVCRAENKWAEETLDPILDACVIDHTENKIRMSVSQVAGLDPAVQRRLFRRAIKQLTGDLRKISFENIEAVRGLLADGQSWKSIDLPHRIRAGRSDKSLVFSKEKGSLRHIPPTKPTKPEQVFTYYYTPPGEITIHEVGLLLVFTFFDIEQFPIKNNAADPARSATVYLDLDKLTFPVIIRSRKVGDRFSPLGLGGTQSVGKYLAGREKDRRQRSLCPVMTCENRIVWIIGYGIADAVKIGPETRRGVKVQVLLAKR
jgi:tRNA(Ile)-lysidine synthase